MSNRRAVDGFTRSRTGLNMNVFASESHFCPRREPLDVITRDRVRRRTKPEREAG